MLVSHTNTYTDSQTCLQWTYRTPLCVPRRPELRRSESCHNVTNSLASSCLNTHSHIQTHTLQELQYQIVLCCHGDREWCHSTWPEKAAAGMLFILKDVCVLQRCRKMQSSHTTRCLLWRWWILLTGLSNQPLHMEDHSSYGLSDVYSYWCQIRRSIPNFGPNNTDTHTQPHIYTVFPASNNNEKHPIEEQRRNRSMVSPMGKKRNTQLYTHTHIQRH